MKLMQRQQQYYPMYCKQEDEESIFNEYCQSNCNGNMGKEDKFSKKSLAPHVHKKIWSHTVKDSNTYNHKHIEPTPYYIVWTIGENVSELNSVIIHINDRCE